MNFKYQLGRLCFFLEALGMNQPASASSFLHEVGLCTCGSECFSFPTHQADIVCCFCMVWFGLSQTLGHILSHILYVPQAAISPIPAFFYLKIFAYKGSCDVMNHLIHPSSMSCFKFQALVISSEDSLQCNVINILLKDVFCTLQSPIKSTEVQMY